MNDVTDYVNNRIKECGLIFADKPILIGGRAMEYYDIRKSGKDIDMIVSNADYLKLASLYPDKRKDLYGDLGIVFEEFEIWRSLAHIDYDFFIKGAKEEEMFFAVSLDRLLWTRVCAMDVEKYWNDLILMREYYYKIYTNRQFHEQAIKHEKSYNALNGAVFAGHYVD